MMATLLRFWLSFYSPASPTMIVYMAQQVEYEPRELLKWLRRLPSLLNVQRRKRLDYTTRAVLLVAVLYTIYLCAALLIGFLALKSLYVLSLSVFVLVPFAMVAITVAALTVGHALNHFGRKRLILRATERFKNSRAKKIAILGSYGKTTTKEILTTILSYKHPVSATPGNQNVLVSHARWILNTVKNSDDFLIVEFGEFKPGDISSISRLVSPDIAILTGYAPNHLDSYKSEKLLKEDLKSIQEFVKSENIYASQFVADMLEIESNKYTDEEVLGWKIDSISVSLEGTVFTISKGAQKQTLQMGLIGEHLVSVAVLSSVLANEIASMGWDDIREALKGVTPHEHRMQPRLISGAWVIDDTYNGNLEGVRAGLRLLEVLPAERKTYVTPGLVEQGDKTQSVHEEIGQLITKAKPDKVVLMDNSVRSIIEKSLIEAGFKGDLSVELNPKSYYEGLEHRLAVGDLVLMQNDWTDNYH